MKLKILFVFSVLLIFSACSSSQESTQNEEQSDEPEIYIFDDVSSPEEDTVDVVNEPIQVEEPAEIYETKFFVQVGAFTSRERAEQFVNENAGKINYSMNISYSDDVKLFVVQLPPFNSRAEAEEVRNKLWQTEVFNDAFILTK